MKCPSCGGRLEGPMNLCPFCGVRQEIDLRRIDFHDSGPTHDLTCPDCGATPESLELGTDPPMHLERCPSCHGMFFNLGELEHLLELETHPVARFDPAQLDRIAGDFGVRVRTNYRRCPACTELMNRESFGGKGGVIGDACRAQGLGLDGGEMRRIAEWWRAGGKFLHQENEAKKVERLCRPVPQPRAGKAQGSIESPACDEERDVTAIPRSVGVVLAFLVDLAT